jgi:hypothetical protein
MFLCSEIHTGKGEEINARENQWGNHEWTMQRHWQQIEDKQSKIIIK